VSTLARGRGKASPQDKEALRIISEKIRELLKEQGKTVSKINEKATPVKKWTVYLVQHTHTDIGYTKPQTEILSEHLRYIDYAIEYCEQTKDYTDDAKFRWTCESAWAVDEYLKNRPEEQVNKLKKYIAEGQIEVASMYFNMSEIVDENSYLEFLNEQPVYFFGKGPLQCLAAFGS